MTARVGRGRSDDSRQFLLERAIHLKLTRRATSRARARNRSRREQSRRHRNAIELDVRPTPSHAVERAPMVLTTGHALRRQRLGAGLLP